MPPITRLDLAEAGATATARRALADVNLRVAKAKKVVVVSGAGISCSSGIPDFRSGDGLYSLVKSRYPESFVTGKDLFSSGLFTTPETTSIFYTFIAELSLACQAAQPTRTHHFINRLEQKGKLLRSYTQNVDGFERRLGIESGGRGGGLKKTLTRNVELHGDLGRVRCVLCYADFEAVEEYVHMFREGEAPSCPACEERHADRINRGARATSVGTLRPSIVLYDEQHPLGDQIGELQAHDMRKRPDVLLIMGTSLKVHGLKHLIKDFAKVVHERKGVVVFVNATAPNKEWEGIIDYHVQGQTDHWVDRVEEDWKKARPQDWETQTILDGSVVHGSILKGKTKPKSAPRPKAAPKLKAKPKAHPSSDDSAYLPTPPASQQTVPSSSPRRSPRKQTPTKPVERDSSSLPTPSVASADSIFGGSSPLTELSSSPSSSPGTPRSIKMTKTPALPSPVSPSKRRARTPALPPPVSPSKRSASRTGLPSQTKRSKTRSSSPSPTKGHPRGKALCALSGNLPDQDDGPDINDEDEGKMKIPALSFTPTHGRVTRASSIPRMPHTQATAATKARLAGLGSSPIKSAMAASMQASKEPPNENSAAAIAPSSPTRKRVSADRLSASTGLARVPSLRAS